MNKPRKPISFTSSIEKEIQGYKDDCLEYYQLIDDACYNKPLDQVLFKLKNQGFDFELKFKYADDKPYEYYAKDEFIQLRFRVDVSGNVYGFLLLDINDIPS